MPGHRFIDVFIHGWDLATATGQDTALDPGLMEACSQIIEPQLELFRAAGAFAAELPVPPDATPQTRFLAMLGRGQLPRQVTTGRPKICRSSSPASRSAWISAGVVVERLHAGGQQGFVEKAAGHARSAAFGFVFYLAHDVDARHAEAGHPGAAPAPARRRRDGTQPRPRSEWPRKPGR